MINGVSFLKVERPRTQRREGGMCLIYVFHHDRRIGEWILIQIS